MSSLMEDEMHVQHAIRCSLQDTGPHNVVFNDVDCHSDVLFECLFDVILLTSLYRKCSLLKEHQ